MAVEGFGSTLWKNVQAVKLGKDGGIEAPVRANGRDGVVLGVGQVAASEAATTPDPDARSTERSRQWFSCLTRR